MHAQQLLIYGANGYTGRLITELASSYNLSPVLAGRNEKEIKELAAKHHCSYRVFDLTDEELLIRHLSEFSVLLHVAGPFKHTAGPMIKACIKAGTHYVDITGEIEVFEMAKLFDAEARKAGVMILPGAGFDVVPTDCLALYLSKRLPDANRLKLAFASLGGGLSHGTSMTMVEGLGKGGAARVQGKIVSRPIGEKGMTVDFGLKKIFVATIPWGDVSTAFFTTGIPNIETYTTLPVNIFRLLKFQSIFNWLLRTNLVRTYLKNQVNKKPAGPSAEKRKDSKSLVWGEVQNEKNQQFAARLICPDGYTLTAHSSLLITGKILQGQFKTGYQTPAAVYGEDFILEIPRTTREDVPA